MSTLGRLLPVLLVVTLTFFAGNLAPGQAVIRAHAPQDSLVPALIQSSTNSQLVAASALVDLLEALSGKRYLRDANLNGVPPLTVNVEGLTKEGTIRLITATFLLNGVVIMPVDDHTMKVVTTRTDKNPRCEGVRVYTTAADLPADDEIVAYYMALDHISPQEAAGIFVQVAPVHTYGAYVPAPSAQGIILTENASVIRELIELKKSIDVTREPNVRPRPPGPRGPGDDRPPGPPPHDHPLLKLIELFLFIGFVVVVIAAGNVLAHLWTNRSGRTAL